MHANAKLLSLSSPKISVFRPVEIYFVYLALLFSYNCFASSSTLKICLMYQQTRTLSKQSYGAKETMEADGRILAE